MEQLLRKVKWATVTRKDYNKFDEDLSKKWPKYEKIVNEDDVIASLAIFRGTVCRPDIPGPKTEDFRIYCCFLNRIMEAATAQMRYGRLGTIERLHDSCLQFVMHLIQQGPRPAHFMFLRALLHNGPFGFQQWFQKLHGEILRNFLGFMKREFYCEEFGNEEYGERYHDTYDPRSILSNTSFRDGAIQEMKQEFIDLYNFMKFSFVGRPVWVKTFHDLFAIAIEERFSGHLLTGVSGVSGSGDKNTLKDQERRICEAQFHSKDCQDLVKRFNQTTISILDAIAKEHAFEDVYMDVLDFVETICTEKTGSPIHAIIISVGSFFNKIREDRKLNLEGNNEMCLQMCKSLIKFFNNLQDHSLVGRLYSSAATELVLKCSTPSNEKQQQLLIDLLVALLKIHQPDSIRGAFNITDKCKESSIWRVLRLIANVHIRASEEISVHSASCYYNDLVKNLMGQFERENIIPQVLDGMVETCRLILERREETMSRAADSLSRAAVFDGRKNKKTIMAVFIGFHPFLVDDTYPWKRKDGKINECAGDAVAILAMHAVQGLHARSLDDAHFHTINQFFITALRGEFYSNKKRTVFYEVYRLAGFHYMQFLDDQDKLSRSVLLLGEVVKQLRHYEQEVRQHTTTLLSNTVQWGPKFLAPFLKTIVEVYLDRHEPSQAFIISCVYLYNPSGLRPYFQDVFDYIDSKDRQMIASLLTHVARKDPELFTDKNIRIVVEEVYQGQDNTQNLHLTVLQHLAQEVPNKLMPHLQTLMDREVNTSQGAMYHVAAILRNTAVNSKDEALGERVMAYFESKISGPEDELVTGACLNEMRGVGAVWRHLLERRKSAIKELSKRARSQNISNQCTAILDILDGRRCNKESLVVEMQKVKETVEELVTRVNKTELGLLMVTVEVADQGKELRNLKTDVKKQGTKMREVERTVEDTRSKVKEIDKKTLSHIPTWAGDVARLMNPEDTLDWRLLSSRVGYSNEDIHGWAQMADPCLSMLDELYATRKASEATFAVLTVLQEINRLDAAVIVENAMKMSKGTSSDEDFVYAKPPEVFLSYQWGIQNEVKLLKQHLEKAGFTCWMDIGQMGGGDKLFEKIDTGIRGAKLIISCVTEKYAKSPNCNREVNMSVNLGKPIIPLLMEKLSWPPPGSMGPIFSEYLFIRFFTRPGEETGDQRYWSAAKFQELLMQLNYNKVQPDQNTITQEYKNWWIPVVEDIKIHKKSQTSPSAEQQQRQKDVETGVASPDVFISYQWGKQKQIQLFYQRLSELGFTCWMDIHQMGGGDSLYDKIDRGVRGAKIVLTCVTTKYALSANCRREVSLADALKKPIVPLLLEKMTWPPTGPMSMVFTGQLYVNFSKDISVQERWEGDKFNELLVSLKQYLGQGTGGQQQPQQQQQQQYSQQQPQQQYSHQQYNQQAQYAPPQNTAKSSSCVLL